MERIFNVLLAVLLPISIFAQTPERMSYQAIIRGGSGNLVTNQPVGMRIQLLKGSIFGAAVYVETQTPVTNANGLVSIEIGGGTVVIGDFSTVDWATDSYFIKTEIDPTGGTSYTITGTSQLLSVPYALHAKTASKVIGGGIGIPNQYYLGQDTLGGIVFYIYLDELGHQKGLIVSKTQAILQWQSTTSYTGANRTEDGLYNFNLMTNSPAKDWISNNFNSEWYLPSTDELSVLWQNRLHVNKSLREGGYTLLSHIFAYWSSTEANALYAEYFSFLAGHALYLDPKTTEQAVRAIKAF